MLQKSGEKTTGWMVPKPCKYWDKLPTSSGAGFLNHQQYILAWLDCWHTQPVEMFPLHSTTENRLLKTWNQDFQASLDQLEVEHAKNMRNKIGIFQIHPTKTNGFSMPFTSKNICWHWKFEKLSILGGFCGFLLERGCDSCQQTSSEWHPWGDLDNLDDNGDAVNIEHYEISHTHTCGCFP